MGASRRETSAVSAARFLATRERVARPYRRRSTPAAPRRIAGDRIALDLAEPTLRLIHDVLCDRIGEADMIGNRLNLLVIAEQMVAAALGMPPCDDPPLTDREVR
jgi:hypothetical protein